MIVVAQGGFCRMSLAECHSCNMVIDGRTQLHLFTFFQRRTAIGGSKKSVAELAPCSRCLWTNCRLSFVRKISREILSRSFTIAWGELKHICWHRWFKNIWTFTSTNYNYPKPGVRRSRRWNTEASEPLSRGDYWEKERRRANRTLNHSKNAAERIAHAGTEFRLRLHFAPNHVDVLSNSTTNHCLLRESCWKDRIESISSNSLIQCWK